MIKIRTKKQITETIQKVEKRYANKGAYLATKQWFIDLLNGRWG